MKHGPNALIDENLPVVVLATRDPSDPKSRLLYEKTLSNIQEVKAREGMVIAVACEGDEEVAKMADHVIPIGSTHDCCCRFSKWCRCSCWRITSRCDAAAMWISRAIWPRASRSSEVASTSLEIRTRGKGLYPFTREVAAWVASTKVETGLLTLFIQHTSASLVIQENADPDVVLDLADFFERLAPENDPRYRHDYRRSRRHARAHSLGADADQPVDSGDRRTDGARHLAGDLCVRAPLGSAAAKRSLTFALIRIYYGYVA